MTAHPQIGAAGTPVPAAAPGTSAAPVAHVPGAPVPPSFPTPGSGGTGPQAPRTWTLEIPGGTVLRTSNDRLSRPVAARLNKALRELGCQLARAQRIPRIERADILTTYIPPPRLKKDRHPLASVRVEDCAALFPSTKALVDGITDSGVFADDNFRHVRREIYQLLDGTCPRGRLKLHIIEVTA